MPTDKRIYDLTIDYWADMENLVDIFIKEGGTLRYSNIASIKRRPDYKYDCKSFTGEEKVYSLQEIVDLIKDDYYNRYLDKVSI